MPTKIREQEGHAVLVDYLRDHPDQPFSASELKQLTGVPKSLTRRLLAGVEDVEITEPPLRFTRRKMG